MAPHQSKRPFVGTRASSQSAITSYFTPGVPISTPPFSSSTIPSPDSRKQTLYSLPPQPSAPNTSNAPTLPYNVQSNLLNVGMRVRKSVPEGYKTGSYSAFTLFADTTTSSPKSTMPETASTPKPRKTHRRSGNRELTPFCGIMKVGGMAGQEWGTYKPGEDMEEDPSDSEDEVPFLSSQGSTSTVSSSGSGVEEMSSPGGNKRRFLEGEEGSFANSNTTFSFGAGFGPGLGHRVLAVPRRKKGPGKLPVHTKGQVRILGLENFNAGGFGAGVSGSGGNEDPDFEDAEFLDYGLAEEVEMGGCN